MPHLSYCEVKHNKLDHIINTIVPNSKDCIYTMNDIADTKVSIVKNRIRNFA